MAVITRVKLSESANGRAIKVAATSSPGTLIHTAHLTNQDETYLSVYNGDSAAREITIQMGGTTSPDDDTKVTIPAKSGRILVISGEYSLTGGVEVRAYCAAAANVMTVAGYVNRIA